MGSGSSAEYSQEDYDSFSLELYETTLQQPCLLPDIGLDESLLKYSGINSNAVLQTYSDGLVDTLPGYVSSLGSALGPLTSVPNAVGLGALLISFIIELIFKSSTQTTDNTDMFRRVFGEEKASSVRDTMSEYLRRHRMFINNEQQLRVEIQRLEVQLSNIFKHISFKFFPFFPLLRVHLVIHKVVNFITVLPSCGINPILHDTASLQQSQNVENKINFFLVKLLTDWCSCVHKSSKEHCFYPTVPAATT